MKSQSKFDRNTESENVSGFKKIQLKEIEFTQYFENHGYR